MTDTQPTRRRFLASAPLAALEAGASRVDRTGGKYGAGLIRNVSVLTRGEALGHGFWVDAVMLSQCHQFMATDHATGMKSRFTHPGMCSDGLAKALGSFVNGRLVGDQVIADLHLKQSAHNSPDGDLATYIIDRAEEDPEHFGTSIVFDPDWDAEDDFYDDHKQEVEGRKQFISPDPANKQNLPHARIAELCACDFVDDPAANPNGLYHRDLSAIQAAEGFLDFALGLSNERPSTVAFGVDPDRAKQFVQRYAAQRGFSLTKSPKEGAMIKTLGEGEVEKPKDDKTSQAEGQATCPECGAKFVPGGDKPPEDKPPEGYAARHQRYVESFGDVSGNKWFFEGVSYEDAQKQHFTTQLTAKDAEIVALKAELADAKSRLAAIANSGEKPLDSSPPPKGTEGQKPTGKSAYEALFRERGSN